MSCNAGVSEHIPYGLPPSRRYQSNVSIKEEHTFNASDRCSLKLYIKHLSDMHVERMKEIAAELPSLVESINQEARRNLWSVTRQALGISVEQVNVLQAEAWAHERWHADVIKQVPCLTMSEAQERCNGSPWDADELLILSHQGRQYVPAFQFLSDGSPSPAWTTLMSVLLKVHHYDTWDLFAWLVRPNVFMNDQPPLLAMDTEPKRVLFVARQVDRDGAL